MSYLPRAVDAQLDQLISHAAAISLEGPKAVGKTETARRRASTVMRLDTQEGAGVLAADPTFSAEKSGTILIDEWQRPPSPGTMCAALSTRAPRPAVSSSPGQPHRRRARTHTAGPVESCPYECGRWRCLNGRGRSRR